MIVVGTGNAAMAAAMAAHREGARVLMLEKGPAEAVGGNSFFAGGGFRFAYDGIGDVKRLIDLSPAEEAAVDVGSYSKGKYLDDLMRVTEGLTEIGLAQRLVDQSLPTMVWMRENGLRWALSTGRQAFKVGDVYRFWGGLTIEAVGGGAGLIQRWQEVVRNAGITIRFDAGAYALLQSRTGAIEGVRIKTPAGFEEIRSGAVVLACGGFEANPEMRTRYLGPGWELAKVRGTRYNTGDGIRMALAVDAQPFGQWSGSHAVAWDIGAPPFGNRVIGDLYQKHSYPLGLIVNIEGKRFVDEGADFRNYTYAKYGRVVLEQPGQFAWQIWDQKTKHLQRDEYNIKQCTKVTANTIEELAKKLDGVNAAEFVKTIAEYNAAVRTDIAFNPNIKDGRHTQGLAVPKSNWANTIDKPPFEGYAVTCGVTFTFGGLRINNDGRVLDLDHAPIAGLYAAGELVGGIFYFNYPGGTGLTSGSVFGKIAGDSAGTAARA